MCQSCFPRQPLYETAGMQPISPYDISWTHIFYVNKYGVLSRMSFLHECIVFYLVYIMCTLCFQLVNKAMILHDATYLYLSVLNQSLAQGRGHPTGKTFRRLAISHAFDGL